MSMRVEPSHKFYGRSELVRSSRMKSFGSRVQISDQLDIFSCTYSSQLRIHVVNLYIIDCAIHNAKIMASRPLQRQAFASIDTKNATP